MRLSVALLTTAIVLSALSCSPGSSGSSPPSERNYDAACPAPGKADNSPKSVALAAACQLVDNLKISMAFGSPVIDQEASASATVRVLGVKRDCKPEQDTIFQCNEVQLKVQLFKNSQGRWEVRQLDDYFSLSPAGIAARDAALDASCLIQSSDVKAVGFAADGFKRVESGKCSWGGAVEVSVGNVRSLGDRQSWEYTLQGAGIRARPEFGAGGAQVVVETPPYGPYYSIIRAEKADKVIILQCTGKSMEGRCVDLFKVLFGKLQ